MGKKLVTKTEHAKERMKKKLNSGMKVIDGDKLQDYIIANNIDKQQICKDLELNRGYINDIIRHDRARTCFFNLICDEIGVDRNFFDYVEKVEEPKHPYVENDPGEFNLELIHDDLMALLTHILKTNALMQEMIDMWRND